MQDRPYRRLLVARLFVVAVGCLVACLAGCTATVQGPNAADPAPGPPAQVAAVPVPSVRVLQLNLCNSGIAGCYTGRSMAAAAAVIRVEMPDLITLNEVCHDDLLALERALAGVVPGGAVVASFQPAVQRAYRRGVPVPQRGSTASASCRAGRRCPARSRAAGSIRPRTRRIRRSGRGCVSTSRRFRRSRGAPRTWPTRNGRSRGPSAGTFRHRYRWDASGDGAAPAVLGGDLNLGSDDSPELRSACRRFCPVDDGGPQHVVALPNSSSSASRGSTCAALPDHPGLLVTLGPAAGRLTVRARDTRESHSAVVPATVAARSWRSENDTVNEPGGDAVCWLHELCPECGAMPTAEQPDRCWRCGYPAAQDTPAVGQRGTPGRGRLRGRRYDAGAVSARPAVRIARSRLRSGS